MDCVDVSQIEITLNGERIVCDAGANLQQLLAKAQLLSQRIAVSRNATIVPKSEYAHVQLVSGDQIEVITAVGGG